MEEKELQETVSMLKRAIAILEREAAKAKHVAAAQVSASWIWGPHVAKSVSSAFFCLRDKVLVRKVADDMSIS